jgi:MYXO-CTERM domain-containing protein
MISTGMLRPCLLLALLALACSPAAAQADSSEIQYDPALPKAGGQDPSQNEEIVASPDARADTARASASPAADGARAAAADTPAQSTPTGEGAGNTSVSEVGPDASLSGGRGDHGGRQAHLAQRQEAIGQSRPIAQLAPSSSGSGSTPTLPILIAIATLAALSFGAFLLLQRRRRSGIGVTTR